MKKTRVEKSAPGPVSEVFWKNRYQKLLAFFFLFALALIFTGSFVPYDLYHENFQENRVLAKPPHFRDIRDIKKFANEVDLFFADNFGFRKILLRYFFYVKMKILKSDINQRVIGKDDWLFLREDVPDYMRTNLFTEKDLDKIFYNLNEMREYFQRKHILFALIVAPNKASIYPEQMPAYMGQSSPQSRLDQVISFVNSKEPGLVIDARNELIKSKMDGFQVYYPWGSHWTALGAFIAWEKIKNVISGSQPGIAWVDSANEVISRFVNKYEEDGWIHYGWPHDQPYRVHAVIRAGRKGFSKDSAARKKVKLVIAGDSFAEDYMGGDMAHAFVDEYALVSYDTKPEVILSYHPDIVILERAERYLDFLLSLKLPNESIIADIIRAGDITSPQPKDFVKMDELAINGDKKEILFEHAPGRVDYKVKIPSKSSLDFSIGMVPACWSPDKGDGVLFRVLINENNTEKIIFDKYIDPKNIAEDRKWHDCSIDLTAYSGKDVILSFITLFGLNEKSTNAFDWSAWGNIRFRGDARKV